MTLRKDEPLVIETPLGLIEIERGDGPHRLLVTLPEGLIAQRGVQRAMAGARYLIRGEDGRIRARYHMLTPRTGPDGELAGVETPPLFRVARSG